MGQVDLSQSWACSTRGICHGLRGGMAVGQMRHSKGVSGNESWVKGRVTGRVQSEAGLALTVLLRELGPWMFSSLSFPSLVTKTTVFPPVLCPRER